MLFNEFSTIFLFIIISCTLALVSILYALILYRKLKKIEVEHEKIKDISSYIYEGAMAFMKRQYRVIIYFAVVIGVILALTELIPALEGAEGVGWRSAIAFVVGALFSGFAGFSGMMAATISNSRTTEAANKKRYECFFENCFFWRFSFRFNGSWSWIIWFSLFILHVLLLFWR
jgi:K(+)-stimulated pyrophosphate-energized sodium pump